MFWDKKTQMLASFYKWKNVRRFNSKIIKNHSDIKYILILHKTFEFKLLDDLNRTFKRKFDIFEYMTQFKKLKCFTMYLTLFTIKERKKLGPIAEDLSLKIILNNLKKTLLNSDVVIIGPKCLKQTFNILSYDSFLQRLLFST